MKPVLCLAVTLAVVLCIEAGGGGRGGGGGGGFSPCDFWLGFSDNDWRARWPIGLHACRCDTGTSRRGPRPNVCQMRPGSYKLGCPVSNTYVQCTNTTCAIQTCPTDQVWNYTLSACNACPAGMHVSADGSRCACNQGTRPDRKTRTCVKCPDGATVEADRCYCPKPVSFDRKNNACKACPATSTYRLLGTCVCTDQKMFWSADDWACKPCPGTWVTTALRGFWGWFGYTVDVCTCTGENIVFDRQSVSCVACPTDSSPDPNSGQTCRCNLGGEVFDMTSKTCICDKGMMRNKQGACAWNATEAAPTSPNAIDP